MIELDFLFVYEHKVRELENLCLIKYELDKRGYRTKILYIEEAANTLAVKPIYHTKVLLVMSCYNNQTLQWQTKDFVKFDKVIDMQWENIVYPKDEDRVDAFKNYIEIGKHVPHISWGRQNERRMLDVVHMDPRKVKVVGHVGMDFLSYPLNRYYLSKEELFGKYGIPKDKETILFASPYYGDCLEESYIADMCVRFGDNWRDYYKFMCESQLKVLSWMERICKENPELYIIFRPHPGHPSKVAEQMAEKLENFQIIGGESVKQWIVTCDRIYTGNSSVVVEAFFAQKMCHILCPYPITEGFELKLISESKKITDFDAFRDSVAAESGEFPTPQSSIEEVYLVDFGKPSYLRFADMAEEVLRDDYYRLTTEELQSYRPKRSFITRTIRGLTRVTPVYTIYLKILQNEKLQGGFLQKQRKLRENAYRIEQEHAHELTSEGEINCIIKKIKDALEG